MSVCVAAAFSTISQWHNHFLPSHLPDPEKVAALHLWLTDHFDPVSVDYWLSLLTRGKVNPGQLLTNIARWDAAPFVHLLYPGCPQLFTKPQVYRLDSTEESRRATLCAASLFALCGSDACLAALLELGADPNGTEVDWDYLDGPQHQKEHTLLLTPTDCALLAGEADCQHMLERFGGLPMDRLCGVDTGSRDPATVLFLQGWGEISSRS